MKAHPAAEIFPPMSAPELASLVASIRERGQTFPIVLHEEMVLDGRHRSRACEILGREPWTVQWSGEGGTPEDYVIAANLDRRHLTDSQRAMIGARLKAYHEGAARERQVQGGHEKVPANMPEAGEAREHAARQVKVSPRSVEHASTVIDDGIDELQDAVDAGEVAVSAAATVAKLPPEEQREIVTKGPDAVKRAAKELREKPRVTEGVIESRTVRDLKRNWVNASDEERTLFLSWLADRGDIKRKP